MKINFFIIIQTILLLSLIGCTDRNDNEESYMISIKNTTLESIELYLLLDEEVSQGYLEQITLLPSEQTRYFFHSKIDNSFHGFFNIDALKVKFKNEKGYLCERLTENNLCFVNKESPLSPNSISAYKEVKTNHFVYEITQSDYENAHDLP
nr:hypothetical protein [uncultured Flavobacterium sp.]